MFRTFPRHSHFKFDFEFRLPCYFNLVADDNPLLAEILAETASAYFGTIRKMQTALAALSEFDRVSKTNELSGAEKTGLRNELLSEAAEKVWFFVVQREAMKLPYYEELFSDFEIPEEVRRNMGPKNRGDTQERGAPHSSVT